ncbi:MAG: acetyltransferase [Pseudomonadota bacterium]
MSTAKPLVIFGTGDFARLARTYFEEDGGRSVAAFAADAAYCTADSLDGKPLLSREAMLARYPPGSAELFVAIGFAKVNKIRAGVYQALKEAGYDFARYVYSRVRLWPSNSVGENSFIFEDNTIQPNVRIGRNVILWSGNHLGHDCVVEDHCFVSSHVCIAGHARIGAYSFLGVNAAVRDGVAVAPRSVLGAGALILGDTEEEGVYMAQATEKARVPSSRLRGL